MPLDKTVQANADAALKTLRDALATRQATAVKSSGKYRQCIAEVTWGTWDSLKPNAATVKPWVDEYVAPGNIPGWILVGRVVDAGVTYVRRIHVAGPETWREQDWTAETKDTM